MWRFYGTYPQRIHGIYGWQSSYFNFSFCCISNLSAFTPDLHNWPIPSTQFIIITCSDIFPPFRGPPSRIRRPLVRTRHDFHHDLRFHEALPDRDPSILPRAPQHRKSINQIELAFSPVPNSTAQVSQHHITFYETSLPHWFICAWPVMADTYILT